MTVEDIKCTTVWSKPGWIALSKSNTRNRKKEDGGVSSRHTGGSIPTEERQDRMAAAWGRDPTSIEVYERVHCSNRKYGANATGPPDDEPIYVYPKAGRVAARFREVRDVAQSRQGPDDPPIDEVALWE
ncbi:hypothetical protein OSB04_029465 [Centaurea solstitialis]|uniref:Uncharacterized protein n=1 Tax=Centaurea solstitialis TaxID=347529 RepID=A0AA38WAA5_9ASTR|nr:hypothetical protein OSB04_029465 [Centaurea solstitialis]